jgi:hypothetical protein
VPKHVETVKDHKFMYVCNMCIDLGLFMFISIMIILNYALQPFKAYIAILVRRSNFRHQSFPRVSPRDSTQRRKVELWARNVR